MNIEEEKNLLAQGMRVALEYLDGENEVFKVSVGNYLIIRTSKEQ